MKLLNLLAVMLFASGSAAAQLNIIDVLYHSGTERIYDQPRMPITNADWVSSNVNTPSTLDAYQSMVQRESELRSIPSTPSAATDRPVFDWQYRKATDNPGQRHNQSGRINRPGWR